MKRTGVVLVCFNPCSGEEEKGRFLGLHRISQPNLPDKFQDSEKTCLKKKKKYLVCTNTNTSGWPPAYMCAHTQTLRVDRMCVVL